MSCLLAAQGSAPNSDTLTGGLLAARGSAQATRGLAVAARGFAQGSTLARVL